MRRRVKLSMLILALAVGFGIFSLFSGLLLGLIFFILWIDKIVLGIMGIPGKFGIEFVTISMILIGIEYGAITGFIFAIILIPLIEGAKTKMTGFPTEWPPFLPSPDHAVDAIVAVVASLLIGFSFVIIVLTCLIVKSISKYFAHMAMGKPPDVLNIAFSFVFNVVLLAFAGSLFAELLTFGPAVNHISVF